jgi:hypothetical protein
LKQAKKIDGDISQIRDFCCEDYYELLPCGPMRRTTRFIFEVDWTEASDELVAKQVMGLLGICHADAPKAKKVILNDPATVVIWDDGTKTVAKAGDGDEYDERVGLLLCAVRKASNNRIRVEDMEGAIRAVSKLKESQMRAISAVLEVMADNRIRVEDMEDAIRVAANLDEVQMRALSAALRVTADNFGE